MVSTIITAVTPEDAPMLATFMCHTSKEQQQTYNDLLTTSQSVRMSVIVGKILTNAPLTSEDFDEAVLGMIYRSTPVFISINFDSLLC